MIDVQGRCPACRWQSLFLGDGGHVTCSRLECPDPCAADQMLHGENGPAATQATEPGSLRASIAAAVDRVFDAWQQGIGETRPQDAVTEAVLTAITSHLDIGEEQAWCKYCRRAWNSPAHRCESDAEQRVQQIARLRDQWLMAGAPPLGTSINRWWDKRLVELNTALNEEQPGPAVTEPGS